MRPDVSTTRRAILLLASLDLLLALANAAPLILGGSLSSPLQYGFVLASMTGWLGLFLFLAAGALSYAAGRFPRAVRWLTPALFTLGQAALFVDVRIYEMFRFHFNGVVWYTLTAPGGWESLHIPVSDVVALGLLVVAVVLAQRWLLLRFEGRAASWPVLTAITWKRVTIVIALCSAADRVTLAAFDLMRDYDIARAARIVPGYQRFTVRHFAKTWFGWEPGSADLAFGAKRSSSVLQYPAKPLTWSAPEKKPNIIWVALESWRRDAFDAEHAPEIWEISKKSQVFEKHVSGGNNTTFGVFSMFYGLHGSYRGSFLAEHRGPILIDRLRELDYRFAIYSSFPMTWPEFRKYTFVDIQDSVQDEWPGSDSSKNDPLVVDAFLSFIDSPAPAGSEKQPFFGFVLLDSSHVPYTFPEEYGKHRPYPGDSKLLRYIDVRQRAPEMRNRYLNAVHWESYQVGRLWKELEKRNLLEDTIVVITGDHGEEFNEHGFWTHSGGYTPEQIQVPLVVWWPGREPARVTTGTSHQDLVPTFLEALGVQNPPADYSLGHSLLETAGRDYVVTCGWRDCGISDELGYVVFGLEGHYAMNFDVLDRDYRSVADPRSALALRGNRLMSVMQEMGFFLK